ncbi:hypothetical protein HY498_03700 [Candidatus Woesearchaeota archaeon]|nr:hypothetical protein [Candidatus Woesearchaeota archaeon]
MKLTTKMILPMFIVVIMLLSTIGFYYTGSEDTNQDVQESEEIEFKGKTFVKIANGYRYKGINFFYSPEELDKVNVDLKNYDFNRKVYFSVNGTLPSVVSKLRFANNAVIASYDDNMSLEYNLPLKDCKDAIDNNVVIKFINKEVNGTIEERTNIKQEGDCYTLEGDLGLAIERFALEVAEHG